MKFSALVIATFAAIASAQASTTIQSSRTGSCYAQTTEIACQKYSWCGWNAESKSCHNTRELKEEAPASSQLCYSRTTESSCKALPWCGWNAESKSCHNTRELKEEALPVCADQKSKLGCRVLPWCVWSNDLCHTIIV